MAFIELLKANTRMHLRNRNSLFWHFAFPLGFMVLFGFLVGQGDRQAPINIGLSGDPTWTQHVETAFGGIEEVEITKGEQNVLVEGLRVGEQHVVIVFDPQATESGQPIQVEILYDPGDAMGTGGVARTMVMGVLDGIAKQAQGAPELFVIEETSVLVDELPFISFLMPGIIGMSVMFSCLFGVASPLVTEREKGILRQVKLTTVRTPVFLAAKSAGMTVLAFLQALIIIGVGMLLFDVEISGSLVGASVVLFMGAMMMVALGMLVAGIAGRVESVDSIAQLIAMPMMFLAGTFFPIDMAPSWLRGIAEVLPLTYLNSGLRDTLVGGQSLGDIKSALIAMAGWTLVFIAAASIRFRWEPQKKSNGG
ncbi:MAG: ABC transporter permease [Actinobacteria bacterium]|nr:ABC transporter permease [Actinomycetota bacterium]MCL5888155.1 ABC transporter permease [Actinomycetota bacterium]